MTRIDCPTLGVPVHLHREALISAHRTATGSVGYARCACGGLVVLAATGGGPGGWEAVSHGAGRRSWEVERPEPVAV